MWNHLIAQLDDIVRGEVFGHGIDDQVLDAYG